MASDTYGFIDLDNNEPSQLEQAAAALRDEAIRDVMAQLIAERQRLGLTQREIAEATGMRTPNITRIESSDYVPSLIVIERYALAVGKSVRLTIE